MSEYISDQTLDQYRDEALPAADAAVIRDRLSSDADLRARLDRLARTDAIVIDGLTASPPVIERAARFPSGRVIGGVFAAAACVGVVVVFMQPAPPAPVPPQGPAIVAAPPPSSYMESAPAPLRPLEAGQASDFVVFSAAVDVPGPVSRGAPVVADAPPPDEAAMRRDRLLRLGRQIHSAMRAEEELDAMPPAEQLEACGIWMAEPSLRPVIFDRLGLLLGNTAVRPDVIAMIEALERDESLRSWLRSYGLASNTN